MKIGDFNDPGFRKWIDFRIETITAFMAEIRQNAVAVSPEMSVIPEIYPGIEQEATRVGADVYSLYPVVDAIAHEYEFGEGDDHTAASRAPFEWMMYQIGIRSFRAFAGEKPTWILNYSWDGAAHVKPADAMQTLFMSELMAGANVWDAKGHVMSGSNDPAERRVVYKWIADHEDIFGEPREPMGDIGVYFSDTTRNYFPKEFLESYRGTILMLLQAHRQFKVVTPRTLKDFHGSTLVLPNVRVLSDAETQSLAQFASHDGRLVIAGQSDDKLKPEGNVVRLEDDPARQYLSAAAKDFSGTVPDSSSPLLKAINQEEKDGIQVGGSKDLVAHAARIHAKPYLFLANFAGVKAGEQLTPTVQKDVRVEVPASFGESMHVLPFLGAETVVAGQPSGDRRSYVIPQIERGTIVWFQ